MSKGQDVISIRPSQAAALVKSCIISRRPVMLWGPPGIGKSDVVRQIAEELGRAVIDIRLLLKDSTDLSGIPYFNPKSGLMEWAHPKDLPMVADKETLVKAEAELELYTNMLDKVRESGTATISEVQEVMVAVETAQTKADNIRHALNLQDAIIFFDEIVSAPPTVMAAAYQIMLDRRVGEYVLPEGVDMVCAGNRQSDRGVVHQMPSPLSNRLIHLHMKESFDDWQSWAINAGVHQDVVGYLSEHKQNLFQFEAKSGDTAFATPRSWKHVSDIITNNTELSEFQTRTLVAGTIGSALANEFEKHMKFVGKLPKVEDILTGKVSQLEVKEMSAHYTLAINMCYTLKDWAGQVDDDTSKVTMEQYKKGVDLFFEYTYNNMKPEMCVLAARTLLRDFKLQHGLRASQCPSFKQFNKKYGDMILDA